MEEENKYHFAREIIFNLRACKQITQVTYLRWIDKLIGEENQAKNNEVLDLVSKSFYCADVLGKCNKQCEDCKDIEKD